MPVAICTPCRAQTPGKWRGSAANAQVLNVYKRRTASHLPAKHTERATGIEPAWPAWKNAPNACSGSCLGGRVVRSGCEGGQVCVSGDDVVGPGPGIGDFEQGASCGAHASPCDAEDAQPQ